MKKFLLLCSIVLALMCGGTRTVFAAEVYFSSPTQDFKTGDKIYFDIFVDSLGESVNAIESDILFPQNLLEYVDYYETSSIITGWVEAPVMNGNSIHFAGIIAGGFSGLIDPVTNYVSPARVVRLVFLAKQEGVGSLSFASSEVFKNDGKGTALETKTLPYQFSISNEGTALLDFSYDTNPPEPFSPLIRRDERFFAGKYFVVFETRDKETGIAYFKVKEGLQSWVKAKSPYLLKDQSLTSLVKVVAVDKNGNEREAQISLDQNVFSKAGFWVFVGLLILLVGVIIFAYVYTRKK
ncbi:MAG: hypothetical protein QG669_365 [Patescibacteria group bacterium]|nr:hypothetical protein [Patescibacteria group bacterium]MDQ5961973.1 hypothetical protein [Patescibacteria group bacterium]